MPGILKIPGIQGANMNETNLATQTKRCDCCGLYLQFSDFYKNKSKLNGIQNRCKDCIKDYKAKLSKGLIESQPLLKREFFYIPDIFLVGYARAQVFQHCCLNCNSAFFCIKDIKDPEDLFCDSCAGDESRVPDKNISKVNYVGHVVGWLAKVENPSKIRKHRNYKKCYIRDEYTCQYCGYNLKNAKKFLPLHIDHVRPWSSQGGNSLENLRVACSECNLLVNDKWFNNFEEKKEFILFEKQKGKWLLREKSH
jgi:5-methylcytosine-specific restriction endonuclease McrA